MKRQKKEARGSGETLKGLGRDYRPNILQPKQLQPDCVSRYCSSIIGICFRVKILK